MPYYDFRCNTCGTEFEKMLRFSESHIKPACPTCESADTQKLLSTVMSFGADSSGDGYRPGCGSGSRGGFS